MVLPHRTAELLEADEAQSFVHKLQLSVSKGLPHAVPVPGLRTEEHELVKAVFQVLQGFETSWLYWDSNMLRYREKAGIYVTHLSLTGLRSLLSPFLFTATCLKQVELFVGKVRTRRHKIPTLDVFASSVDSWLKRLREAALKEEEKLFVSDNRTITLLGLTDSLSSLRSGAEHLSQVLHRAVPDGFWDSGAHVASSEVAVHILDHLFKKLNEVCLLEDGEGEPFHMLLVIFTGSLLPYLQCLDSWIYDGILDDPCEEMFFYANNAVTIDQPAFWEMSYMLRVRGSRVDSSTTLTDSKSIKKKESSNQESNTAGACLKVNNQGCVDILCPVFLKDIARAIVSAGKSFQLVQHVQDVHQIQTTKSGQQKFWPDMSSLRIHDDRPRNKDALEVSTSQFGNDSREMGLLTLSEIFLICLSGLLENGDHVYEYLRTLHADSVPNNNAFMENGSTSNLKGTEDTCAGNITEKTWLKLLKDATSGRRCDGTSTDYKFGFQFDDLEYVRQVDDRRTLEDLYAFPTLLPCAKENALLSEILPMQKDSALASRVLKFIQNMSVKDPLQPVGIIQECLSKCINRQVDHIGNQILSKLMGEWRLMDELFVLRAIYLLGSGDMLQQFLITIFDKLDRGNSWDDDFELNNLLQESIRNSADKMLLTAPDSLVVSLAKHDTHNGEEGPSTSKKGRALGFGIDALDMLNFTYKVSWPLDLIVNTEALKNYNQVMGFLLKVKRAKFVLDETQSGCGRGRTTHNIKQHLIVAQKLLHFVDAFHQYVMDRVYHSAWTELCDGMASATTLDEVMEVHEAYLSSIQRQCFVASDKLWALIASRVKTILGLALDFHNVEQTLSTGGTASAVRARCEMETDRIEKQFDECVVFLLRILSFKLNVGHFPHLADLVTRINYNHYFMSDNGSFSAIPGSRTR
ncbi:unnamed protein product [Miscanthus lutarioriparius]|uniref:Gamma-tubulin complex component n=1 Tax=Miscanthus lutarioriparius TaxID=422564 RepID=A0A811N2A5_9POAL|nr:unnamed protein product [Miscanthus lutarioriparius]